ncbi:MAG TPA: cupin domain-containing protein [Candidatus Bathyarchaeia archaeon]|nr:cupin domain-containing protein [Candidatus Bathyarchaeia archaeon]
MVSPNQGNIAVHLSEMKPSAEALKHAHETSEQVYIVLSGRATMTVGGETFNVKKGDVVYIPANVEHQAKVVGRETFKSMIVTAPPL